jgi:hypothetical protein
VAFSWNYPPKESFRLKIIRMHGCAIVQIVQIVHGLSVYLSKSREIEGVHVRVHAFQLLRPALDRCPASFIFMAEEANALAGEQWGGRPGESAGKPPAWPRASNALDEIRRR